MSRFTDHNGPGLLISGLILLCLYSCETSEPPLYPDYTGRKGQLTDIEGNVYNTFGIGSQIWMAGDLKTGFFNDNSVIPIVLNDYNAWQSKFQ